jgi:hypothetical protein
MTFLFLNCRAMMLNIDRVGMKELELMESPLRQTDDWTVIADFFIFLNRVRTTIREKLDYRSHQSRTTSTTVETLDTSGLHVFPTLKRNIAGLSEHDGVYEYSRLVIRLSDAILERDGRDESQVLTPSSPEEPSLLTVSQPKLIQLVEQFVASSIEADTTLSLKAALIVTKEFNELLSITVVSVIVSTIGCIVF